MPDTASPRQPALDLELPRGGGAGVGGSASGRATRVHRAVKGGRQRIVPVSNQFFATVAEYLEVERSRTSATDRVFVVLKGANRGSDRYRRPGSVPASRVTSGMSMWAAQSKNRSTGCRKTP